MTQRNEFKPDEIVIVGGGPVGLYTAIQLAHNGANVQVIEKYTEYKRTQHLKLNLALIDDDELRAEILKKGVKLDRQHVEIPIQALENIFLTAAKKLNIKINYQLFSTEEHYQELLNEHHTESRESLEQSLKQKLIVGIPDLKKQYPQARIIIGADGSRSAVRETISDKVTEAKPLSKKDLRYIVELQYKVHGKVDKLWGIQYVSTETMLGGFLCTEHIKYSKEDKQSNVTLRFMVDEATYNHESLNNVNAKNLLPLNRNIPQALRTAINVWMNTRKDKDIIVGTPTLNKTTLSIYTSKKYAEKDEALILLVGDASCGFPFMNGLNLGIKNCRELVKLIGHYWHYIRNNDDRAIKQFISSYSNQTAKVFAEGSNLVGKTNQRISLQLAYARASFFLTYPIKEPIRYSLSGDHEIFFAHDALYLEPLKNYIKHSHCESKAKLCQIILELLQSTRNDEFDRIKNILFHAYLSNRQLEQVKLKQATPGSPMGMQQKYFLISELEDKHFTGQSKSFEIPKVLNSIEGEALSQKLHTIIYDLYQRTLLLESLAKLKNTSKDKVEHASSSPKLALK